MTNRTDIENKAFTRITDLLKKILKNDELLNDYLNKIKPFLYPETKKLVISDNMISFNYPNGDSYCLIVDKNGNGIEGYYSAYSQGLFQKETVTFLDDLIFVVIEESRSQIDSYTSLPSRIERYTSRRTYKDNEIVYERKFSSIAASTLSSYYSETKSEETYVSNERIAYRRNITIDNQQNNIPQVTYSKCYAFNPTPFNNLVNNEKRDIPFFVPSNENEYSVYTLRLTRQEPVTKK